MKNLVFATIFSIAALTQTSMALAADSQFVCFSRENQSFFQNPSDLQRSLVSRCDVTKPFSFSLIHNPDTESYSGAALVCCWTPQASK